MKTSDFDYDLPPELIAQKPLPERAMSKMMVVRRETGELFHKSITDLIDYLDPGDLLVVNDTRVIPARLFGSRADTGGKIELLLLENKTDEENTWHCLCKSGRSPRPGMVLNLANDKLKGEIVSVEGKGKVTIQFSCERPFLEILDEEGVVPVPPYIRRDADQQELLRMDRARYQTVYADQPGAVAAPTAGLHFTKELIGDLEKRGIKKTTITLHVGVGTFRPVDVEDVESHVMDEERFVVSEETAALINRTRENGGRIVAVGSTTVRTLETVMAEHGSMVPCSGRSSLFIYPPYKFNIVDLMLTNFHLPKSSLLMMVSAFSSRELALNAYSEAVEHKYRFYSYGDCMLLL